MSVEERKLRVENNFFGDVIFLIDKELLLAKADFIKGVSLNKVYKWMEEIHHPDEVEEVPGASF